MEIEKKRDLKLSLIFILFVSILILAFIQGYINFEGKYSLIYLIVIISSMFLSFYYSLPHSKDKFLMRMGKSLLSFTGVIIFFLVCIFVMLIGSRLFR